MTFDPHSPAVIADPFAALAELRARDPVHWSDALGGWVLTRYEDVRLGLRDPRFSADRIRPFFARLPPQEQAEARHLAETVAAWAVFVDPPAHTRLRALMNRAFTSRALASLRPKIEAIVDELIAGLDGRERIDLIGDFSYPLPATVIAHMLGVPQADVPALKRWSDQVSGFVLSARLIPDKRQQAIAGMREMADYFHALVAAKRQRPANDVLSRLIAAEERGQFLSADELVATCSLLLFAGHETTTFLIANGFLALLANPDQLDLLRAGRDDPELVASAIEEILRWDGPSLSQVRVMAEDVELAGKTLRTGERVFLMIGAAHRDPSAFPDPDTFDIRRQNNQHLAFGYGIHFCVGAPLARLEARIAFPKLLDRFDGFRLVEPEPRWNDNLVMRSVDRVNLELRRRAA
jgi:cytochrome P450